MESIHFKFDDKDFQVPVTDKLAPIGFLDYYLQRYRHEYFEHFVDTDAIKKIFLEATSGKKLIAVDAGGSGDCLIKALNQAIKLTHKDLSSRRLFTSSYWYSEFNLDVGTYLEDKEIMKIASSLGLVLIVIREFQGETVFQGFGKSGRVYMIYNDYPRHYYSIILEDLEPFPEVHNLPQFVDVPRLDIPADSLPEDLDEGPQEQLPRPGEIYTSTTILSKFTENIPNDPAECEIEDPTLEDLYKYLQSRFFIKDSGFQLDAMDSKIFYKLRHNVFKTVFLDMLGVPSSRERSLEEIFGIPSKKTPDCVVELSSSILILEFTVVKTFQRALDVKKSRSKYNIEQNMVQDHTKKKTTVLYPTLILEGGVSQALNDFYKAAEVLEATVYQEPETAFNQILENFKVIDWNIAEIMPEILMNEEASVNVNFQQSVTYPMGDLFHAVTNKIGAKRKRSVNIMSRVKRHLGALERDLKFKPGKERYKITINNKSNAVYISLDEEGAPKSKLLNKIQSFSLDILEYCKIVGKFDDSELPFSVYGKVGVSGNYNRKSEFEVKFDTDVYEARVKKALRESSNSSIPELLGNNLLSESVGKVEKKYLNLLKIKRKQNNTIVYEKNPFIFPIAAVQSPGQYKPLKIKVGLTITDYLLRKITTVSEKETAVPKDIDYKALRELESEIYSVFLKISDLTRPSTARILKRSKDLDKQKEILAARNIPVSDELLDALKSYNEIRGRYFTVVKEPTRKFFKNLVPISRSMYKDHWKSEIEHFGQKKGLIKMAEEVGVDQLLPSFEGLVSYLYSETTDETPDDVYSNTEPQGIKLAETCRQFKCIAEPHMRMLKRTKLVHNLLMISRLAYSVLYYSNVKLNKEDFCFDNLGYSSCLLIVKGGKKVISSKRSRLFKFIFKIDPELAWIYKNKYTTITTDENGDIYCVLPWQTWHFNMLKKATELYYSFPNYFVSSYLESGLDKDQYIKFVTVKTLNMFSQRRKLEIWFGSFRYLYLNSLSSHTNVLELLSTMVDFDYDPYMYLVQRLFARRYKDLYENANKGMIYDIFTNEVFDNFDLCAEKFDECLFMTMAPFDRVNEHLRNLISVLEVQKGFLDVYNTLDPFKILEMSSVNAFSDTYVEDLFKDDFKFDPKVSFCIGDFVSKYLVRVTDKSSLASRFSDIVTSSYTEISTSKGMRSSDGPFWGEKGHDVVHSNKENVDLILEFLKNLPETNQDFIKILKSTQVTFKDKIELITNITLEFDIKDKQQWKGSREIYVMSDMTKTLQQPLERFFKILCTFMPNELINKKSHIRPKFIHSQVFEFETEETSSTYCTLDCRKWAPKSNIWKYYYFILGMQNILPESFINYFLQVWFFMFQKKVRINSAYVEKLQKNPNSKDLTKFLIRREDGDFELVMPYSFMMGIYNYLSTLFHAASQLYFNEKISSPEGVTFNFIAHSDDSGGVITSKSYEKNIAMFKRYEVFQKSCNHLLSIKKSALSKKMFEVISIMYANKRLIPMTHKFLANVSFEPKGKGWADDISSVVSKVVELFSNGASLLQCYLTMLTMTEMIRKFYHIPRLTTLSKVPLAFGGIFNMHPLHLILLGADSQEVMLDLLETDEERTFRIICYRLVCNEYVPGKGGLLTYKLRYYKRHPLTLDLDEKAKEVLKNVALSSEKSTFKDVANHFSQMFDQSYVYSLSGVDMCQIFCSTLFHNIDVVLPDKKLMDFKNLCMNYTAVKSIKVGDDTLNVAKSQYHNYMKAAEAIFIDATKMTLESKKTCKPITYETFENLGISLDFKTLSQIVSYNTCEAARFVISDVPKVEALTQWVCNNLPGDDLDLKMLQLGKLLRKDMVRVRSSYCFIPSNVNVDTVERFWTFVNFYCTRRYKISTEKPQYYTVENFSYVDPNHSSLKHYFLLQKVIMRNDLTPKLIAVSEANSRCTKCANPKMSSDVKDFLAIRKMEDYESLHTTLPFATYQTKQRRSATVWYGQSDFTIYTMFGDISLVTVDGVKYIEIHIETEQGLDLLWFYFKTFCQTRGILNVVPVYDVNDTGDAKLAFTDLYTPFVAAWGYRGMMIKNSFVYYTNVTPKLIEKREGKYMYNGDYVDFEIYYNYDINETFYSEHNLKQLDDFLFDDEYVLDRDYLLRNISSSKLYKMLMLDESQWSQADFKKKYWRTGLLGSSNSLTGCLAIGDSMGLTRYRSSVNPDKLDTSVLEGQSYSDIPVLDLISKCSFLKMNYTEFSTLSRIIKNEEMDNRDTAILDGVVHKLGINPVLTNITVMKTIFRELSYEDVSKLKPEVLKDFLYTMVKSALIVLTNSAGKKVRHDPLPFETKEVLLTLSLLIKFRNVVALADLLSKLFLKCAYLNPGMFWENRKDNIYCALYRPNRKNINNQAVFLYSILNRTKQKDMEDLTYVKQVKLTLNKNKSIFEDMEEYTDAIEEIELDFVTYLSDFDEISCTNFYLESGVFEDGEETIQVDFDNILGNEDPENPVEREWDPDAPSFEVKIMNNQCLMYTIETTLRHDYSSVTIKSLFGSYHFPWLGHCDCSIEKDEDGILWHTQTYPGSSQPPLTVLQRPYQKVKMLNFNEIIKKEPTVDVATEDTARDLSVFVDDKRGLINKNILTSDLTDVEIFDYQCQALLSIGVKNPEHFSRFFLKRSDVSDTELFWARFYSKIDDFLGKKMQSKILKSTSQRTTTMPGYIGSLKDGQIVSELKTLFGPNAIRLLGGNQKISVNTYRNVMHSIRLHYNTSSDSDRALLTIVLATLKDSVICSSNDDWYLETIFGILNDIEAKKMSADDQVYIPPKSSDTSLQYEVYNPYRRL